MKTQAQFSFKLRVYKTVTIVVLLLFLVGSFWPIPTGYTSASAQSTTNDLSQRYVIFLNGIRTSASETSNIKLDQEFGDIQRSLEGLGISRFVYFSYSAVNYEPESYCNGWGAAACAGLPPPPPPPVPEPVPTPPPPGGDLVSLSLSPIYSVDDTKHSIADQAIVLNWLIGQIVQRDPSAQIDLVGWSLGGLVSAYWASHQDNLSPFSAYHSNIHSIVMIESPVGGIPGAGSATGDCLNSLCPMLRLFWGLDVLRELQLPEDTPGSIVGSFPQAARNFPNAFTSIQSTADYIVNGESINISLTFPLCGLALECTAVTPVGTGSQFWVSAPHFLHNDERLGPTGLAPSTPPLLSIDEAIGRVTNNHSEPLHYSRTAQWIVEAITESVFGRNVIRQGFNTDTLPANDDSSTGLIEIGFPINFFGNTYSHLYINNNGNVTFDAPMGTYTPFPLLATNRVIIAPFFADVDTRQGNIVRYGSATVGQRPAFGVTWPGVGCYNQITSVLNYFQVVLIDRSDIGPGDFDIEFNYEQIQWETGTASGGNSSCQGGSPARVGFSNGTSLSFELPGSGTAGAFLDSNTTTGLIHNSRDSLKNGRYIFNVRNGGAPVGGTISGTIVMNNETSPLPGAFVQVCGDSFCHTTQSNNSGQYSISGLNAGSYTVRAFPPGNTNLEPGTLGPIDLGENQTITGQNITLTGPTPIPNGTTITSRSTGAEGIPVVYWAEDLTLVTQGCVGGSASYQIVQDSNIVRSSSMTEDPSGTYTAAIPQLYPVHGYAQVSITITCPDSTTTTIEFDIYIDPSGHVRTPEGAPIEGATVTLFRSDSSSGPFEAVPDESGIMSIANRRNPDATDSDGRFGWDVIAGYYQVRAEKEGCTSPADTNQFYVETDVLTVPPAATDLDLRLACAPVNQPPELSVPDNLSVQYSDLLAFNVSATDPDDASNTLIFSATNLPNNLVLTDNGDGTATITGIANVAPGTYTTEITVIDPDGLSDTKSVDIIVAKEDARTTYTGPLMVSTACETCSTVDVPLRATIQDISAVLSDPAYDPDAGNITNATVSFVDRNNGDAELCSSNVMLLDQSDQTVGTAFCNWTADLGNSSGNDYVVGVVVDGYYTRSSSDEDTVVVVSKPTSNFITGGGYFINQNSGGSYFGDQELKTNFGLTIKFNKKLTNLQGHVTIIVRQDGHVYQIKSNALSSLVSVPYDSAKPKSGTAELIGKANVTDVTDPQNPIVLVGNTTLDIVMKDNGEPGDADLISISLWSKDGELLFSSNWDGVQTVEQLLDGGNLSIK